MSVPSSAGGSAVHREPFGRLPDGSAVEAVTLRNGRGLIARVITWGAALQSLAVPDRTGTFADVVLGYPDLERYLAKPQFFGATVGRYANRLCDGRFTLDGVTYQVPPTDGRHALHGGREGFDKRPWAIRALSAPGERAAVTLHRISPDGEEGFPGTLDVEVRYTLGEDDRLTIAFAARTDKPTVLNLTNHTYFNLAGEGAGRSALGHRLRLAADSFLPVDAGLIPTGEIQSVAGTPLDFRETQAIGARIRDGRCEQLVRARGYDFTYVLREDGKDGLRKAARLEEPTSGRVLSITTTQPGVQFYSGNFLDATSVGKSGNVYRQGDAVAFETQHFPDSPNQPAFPSTRLDPGRIWRSETVWRFTTADA